MESLVDVIKEFFRDLKKALSESENYIGKEVIDADATRKGVVVDLIKHMLNTKVSLLGVRYKPEEEEIISTFDEDVIVIQSGGERYFVSMSDISAVGSVILLKKAIDAPEVTESKKLVQKVLDRYDKIRKTLESFEKIGKKLQ
ncbi:MAG: hypothetical protein J7K83_01860 [Candidatus Aenigmarchaeota archaeon]|nr:hypothetical protein [Candidatus Aenigmarchaeota archaeon]